MDIQTDTDVSRDTCDECDDDGNDANVVQNDTILKGVVAYVDVWSGNENMSEVFRKELVRLGATVVKRLSSRVTHVIFKAGNHKTITKAQKMGVHCLSVLWVDGCKQKNEHISEQLFPAFTPKNMGNPFFAAKRKIDRWQPTDYEEDLARNAKKVARKQRRLDAINRLKSDNSTPTSSPRAAILVQDTQPRSPDSEYRFTPIRLRIPETPPSMREKLRLLRLAKQGASASASVTDEHDQDVDKARKDEMRQEALKPLQKQLFTSQVMQPLDSSLPSSLECSPVFLPVQPEKINGNTSSPNTSITDDILEIAENINTTLNHESSQHSAKLFGVDSDENLLSSQEIVHITNNTSKSVQNASVQISADSVNAASDTLDSKEKSDVENKVPKVSKSRRSSRRLSVQQTLQELDKSSVVINECVDELNEDQVCPRGERSRANDSVMPAEVCDIPVDTSNDSTVPKNKRKSISKKINENSKGSGGKRRRTKSAIVKSGGTNGTNVNVLGSEEEKSKAEPLKQKRVTKKKLMSLSELNDQQSVLLEPSKCSQDCGRAGLLDTNEPKRGKEKQNTHDILNNIEECVETKREDTVSEVSEEVNSHDRSRKKGGKKATRKKAGGKENISRASAVSLVNDTHADLEISAALERNCNSMHSNTTQMNLTKDTSVSVDLRETTLSMSMSRAYCDNSMNSVLGSNRKSIDEFSVSQMRKQRRQRQMKRYLASVTENDNMSTDSDNGVEGQRVKVRGNTSQLEASALRKNVRPSMVMTSLHSHEQDVVISVVKKLGGFVISENVNETTTHVICGEPRRTLNVLQCMARGVWLLSKEWVLKSLEAETWIEEGQFECSDLFPTCSVARQERENSCGLYRQTIFMGLGHIYVSGRSSPPRQHLVQLIKLCGGQVTGLKEKANLYVGSEFHPGLTCLKTNWILDCISSHRLLSMDLYKLDRPKRDSSPEY